MNLIYYALVCSLFNSVVLSTCLTPNLKKIGYRIIILTKKETPKLLNIFKKQFKNYYDKTIVIVSESLIEYENMSYEDKQIIEFITSFIF
jgi:hypothetical protein